MGVYLSDLTYNAERPAFIDSDPNSSPQFKKKHVQKQQEKHTDKMLINFDRFRTSANIVKSLMQCIEWSCNYKFTPNHDILAKCLYIQSLTEEEMESCYQYLDEASK